MPDDHAHQGRGSDAEAIIAEIEDTLDELVLRCDDGIAYEAAAREWWATFKSVRADTRKIFTSTMFEKMLRFRVRQIDNAAKETQAAAAAAAEDALKDLHINTQGVPIEQNFTDRFAEAHKDMLRFNGTRGEWMLWDETRWRPDAHYFHLDLARRFTGRIAEQAIVANNKAVLRFATRNRFVEAILRLAIGHPNLSSVETDYDIDPYLLNTSDGIYDLRTLQRHDNAPRRMQSKVTRIAPDFDMATPIWDAFLAESFGGKDRDTKGGFLLDWFGYRLSGDVSLENFLFLWGPGGNGKGTLVRTISQALGDYCRPAAKEAFISDAKSYAPHPTVYADLAGCRLVTVSETGPGESFRMDKIKEVSGNEVKIPARFLYKKTFLYDVTFGLAIISNEALTIETVKQVDPAVARRLHVVHADHTPEREDPTLKKRLEAEMPGILADLMRRCRKVLEARKIEVPSSVNEDTSRYLSEQDVMGAAWDAVTEGAPGAVMRLTDAAKAMTLWGEDNGAPAGPKGVTSQMLRKWIEANKPHLLRNERRREYTLREVFLTEKSWRRLIDYRRVVREARGHAQSAAEAGLEAEVHRHFGWPERRRDEFP